MNGLFWALMAGALGVGLMWGLVLGLWLGERARRLDLIHLYGQASRVLRPRLRLPKFFSQPDPGVPLIGDDTRERMIRDAIAEGLTPAEAEADVDRILATHARDGEPHG